MSQLRLCKQLSVGSLVLAAQPNGGSSREANDDDFTATNSINCCCLGARV